MIPLGRGGDPIRFSPSGEVEPRQIGRRELDPLDEPMIRAFDIAEAREQGHAAAEDDRRWRLAGIFLAAISGAIVGFMLGIAVASAAPRSAQTTERVDVSAPSSAGPIGAPPRGGMPVEAAAEASGAAAALDAGVGGAPRSPDVELGTAIAGGQVAYASPSYGDRYLALPEGPGIRVRICSSHRTDLCLDRVSTDAGPALSMQRLGRIADVSYVDFAFLCSCRPELVGLLEATIEYPAGPGLTPPPTSVEP